MKFAYTPEGADTKTWDFRPGTLPNVEAEAIEDATGWTYTEFGVKFMKGSSKAYHALLWVYLRRTHPGLKYDQVEFTSDEIEVSYEPDETRGLIAALEALPNRDPEESFVLDMLRDSLPDDAATTETLGVEADPKD